MDFAAWMARKGERETEGGGKSQTHDTTSIIASAPSTKLRLQIDSLKHELDLARTQAAKARSEFEGTIKNQEDRIKSLQIKLADKSGYSWEQWKISGEKKTWT